MTAMQGALKVLIRVVALTAAYVAYFAAVPLIWGEDKEGGANIGAGILAFLGLAVIAAVWGFLDGRVVGVPAAVVWAITGIVAGVVIIATQIAFLDSGVFWAELPSLGLFLAGWIVVPGCVGAAVGGAFRR